MINCLKVTMILTCLTFAKNQFANNSKDINNLINNIYILY